MTESTADRATYVTKSILPVISADTDLIIIQLIDNVNTDARLATFQADSIDMIKKFAQSHPMRMFYGLVAGSLTTTK